MKRLTTDDEKSLFYPFNLFYEKDHEVWIRGGGPHPDYQDVTLVQWVRRAAEQHQLNIVAENAEYLGDEMYDALQDGSDTIEGIVALLHAAAVQATEMRSRLKEIEDIIGDDYELPYLYEMVEDSKWISVKDHLPPERDSIFKKLIGLEKWREGIEGLCQRESDYVIVSVRFSDGTEKTGRARTEDGHWVELPTIGCPVVTHWRPFPKPCNGGK